MNTQTDLFDFGFLADALWEFIDSKKATFGQPGVEKLQQHFDWNSSEDFLAFLNNKVKRSCLPLELVEKFILPIKDLSRLCVDTVEDEGYILNETTIKYLPIFQEIYSWLLFKERKSFLFFEFSLKHKALFREENTALSWLLSQVANLNLPGLDLFSTPSSSCSSLIRLFELFHKQMPYRQCLWCGSIKDEDGIKFPEVRTRQTKKYCHISKCDALGDTNPNAHAGCCYGHWRRIQINFLDKKIKRYWLQKPGLSIQERKESVKEVFLAFCEERYQDNLKRNIGSIQTKTKYVEEEEFFGMLRQLGEEL